MGVLTLQLLVCGQLILFSLVVNNITYAQPNNESPTKAPPLTATGNQTKNNASDSSSISAFNGNATTQNLTTQATTVGINSTVGPTQSNVTVTGPAVQPNSTTTDQTTQSGTSSTINISSTAATSTDNSTHSNNKSTTPVTKPTVITSTSEIQNSSTSSNESQGGGLNHSEKSLTILFSVLLGVIVLVILVNFMYKYGRSKERSIQYTHRRLQNEDTGESFAVSDDTLVISGGLYDGPQIYNPTMTVQNDEEYQTDIPGYASRPSQFRLEFLREDQDRAFDSEASTFQTFHAHDQEP